MAMVKIDIFKKAYRESCREIVRQAITQIQLGMGEAINTLKDVMNDEKTPASARVSAAAAIFPRYAEGKSMPVPIYSPSSRNQEREIQLFYDVSWCETSVYI